MSYYSGITLQVSLVDMSEIDVILISNYHCMLALPYITQNTSFRGIIYMTDPTLHFGRYIIMHTENIKCGR